MAHRGRPKKKQESPICRLFAFVKASNLEKDDRPDLVIYGIGSVEKMVEKVWEGLEIEYGIEGRTITEDYRAVNIACAFEETPDKLLHISLVSPGLCLNEYTSASEIEIGVKELN